MAAQRKIEIFSAGCAVCKTVVDQVRDAACPSCDVIVLDMRDKGVAERAERLGIRSVPAVVIDGALADCCAGRGPDMTTLRRAGLGQPLS
ncbi:MAG: thioredoxin family protein [Alphaproteobacteria bacterium]|nr:thioredoxin family protein [Alphaproteobacteria bacterium]